jgi:hypothetical protein
MDIKQDIIKQIQAGFNKQEIDDNLRKAGYSQLEVEDALKYMPNKPKRTKEGAITFGDVLKAIALIGSLIILAIRLMSR